MYALIAKLLQAVLSVQYENMECSLKLTSSDEEYKSSSSFEYLGCKEIDEKGIKQYIKTRHISKK